jgi:hypothetical protein
VKYQFEAYPGAVHSFTLPEADKKEIKGMADNAEADKKSAFGWACRVAARTRRERRGFMMREL